MTTSNSQGLVSELGLEQASEGMGVTRTRQERKEVRENRMSQFKDIFFRIFGHEHPRLHDLLAIYFLINEGWRRGISFGSYELIFQRSIAPDHQTVEEMIAAREITICAGHGPFSKVQKVNDNESVTKNVARELGIHNDPVYAALIEWSHNVEAKGPGSWRETAGMIRELSLANLDNSAYIFQVAQLIFDSRIAVIIEELRAESDLKASGEPVAFKGLRIGWAKSDATMIPRVSRRAPFDWCVCVRISSTGHVLITSVPGVNLTQVVASLRRREAELAGEPIPNDLTVAWKVGRWVLKTGSMHSIINGGLTDPETPPTAISQDELVELVIDGLS